jgi:hypothetical protein
MIQVCDPGVRHRLGGCRDVLMESLAAAHEVAEAFL